MNNAMPGNWSVVITVLGVTNIVRCLFGGLYYFVLGVMMACSPGGQGLQIIFGIPFAIYGAVLMSGVRPAFLLLKKNAKGRSDTISNSVITSVLILPFLGLFAGLVGYAVLMLQVLNLYLFVPRIAAQFDPKNPDQLTPNERLLIAASALIFTISMAAYFSSRYQSSKEISDFNPYNLMPDMVQSMDAMITKEFSKHETVVLKFYYRNPPYKDKAFYQQSEAVRQQIDFKRITTEYLKLLAPGDVIRCKQTHGDSFIAEVTRAGWEKLRHAKNMKAVELFDTAIYGGYLWN